MIFAPACSAGTAVPCTVAAQKRETTPRTTTSMLAHQGLNRGMRPRSKGNPLIDSQAGASNKTRRDRSARALSAPGDSEASITPPADDRRDGPPSSGAGRKRSGKKKSRTGSGRSPTGAIDASGTSSEVLATRTDPGNAGAPQGSQGSNASSNGKFDDSGDSDEEVILMKPAASKSGKGTAETTTEARGRERNRAAIVDEREVRSGDIQEVKELLRNSIKEGQKGLLNAPSNGTPSGATAETAGAKLSERPQLRPSGRAATAPGKGPGSTGPRGIGRQRKLKEGKGKEEMKEEPLLCGEGPDVRWRCVPEEHLRAHPLYHGLPEPDDVVAQTIIDVSRFRQSSWQWDALHDGRCTTSRAAACLGFYEPLAAELLRVPRSLQGHHKAVDAWHKLLQPPLPSLDLLNDSQSSSSSSSGGNSSPSRTKASSSRLWRPPKEGYPHWSHSYHPPPPRRGGGSGTGSYGGRNIRMAWGNAQEATSVLTALNYFATVAPGTSVAEVGLCPAEAHHGPEPTAPGAQHGPPLLLGASPDGVVVHPDGTFEALEVKNHSPYRYDRYHGVTVVRDPGPWAEIANWHVPQLALEMYCMGPRCRGVLFVSQSATKGAAIMRLRRDDDYIELMLSELRLFHRSFVVTGAEPPEGFGSTRPSHRRLLDATLRASSGAEVVAVIPNHQVQRSPWGGNDTMFLWPASHPPPPARRQQQQQQQQQYNKRDVPPVMKDPTPPS